MPILEYDALNRVTNMVDAVGTTRYTYLAGGALLAEDGPWANDTVSYGYQNGLRMALTNQQPTGAWTNGFGYDAARRLTFVTSPAGTFAYLYTNVAGLRSAGSLVARIALPNAAYITNTFDASARLLSTRLNNSAHTTLNAHGYQLNAANQRSQQTRTDGSTVGYTYDNLGQVIQALGSGGFSPENHGYGYDPAQNLHPVRYFNPTSDHRYAPIRLRVRAGQSARPPILCRLHAGLEAPPGRAQRGRRRFHPRPRAARTGLLRSEPGVPRCHRPGEVFEKRLGQALFERPASPLSHGVDSRTNNGVTLFGVNNVNQLTTGPGGNYSYDANGNLTSESAGRTFTYDAENQLTSVTYGTYYRTDLVYDGRMRLRVRKEYTWMYSGWYPNGETRYVYDGMRVIQERNSGNTPTVSYTRGHDLSGSLEGAGGIGGLLARSDQHSGGAFGRHVYYHADGNGNVTMLVDTNQAAVATYRYDPFGRSLYAGGTLAGANVYRFSSKELLASSGLYYYGYRLYEPNLQRWVNRDPLTDRAFRQRVNIPASRKRIDRNLYQFVFNRPTRSVDPLGLTDWPWPANGSVCNCPASVLPVCVLIDGDYFTLPPGKCTADAPLCSSDVDGYWVGTTFYKVNGMENADACKPKGECAWNWEPEGSNRPGPGKGGSGAKIGDAYPDGCGPIYEPPPVTTIDPIL